MITCPWCGTNYAAFQSNCKNCGGPLPAPTDQPTTPRATGEVLMPPPAPRPIADSYAWRLVFTEGAGLASAIVLLIGSIFALVGFILTIVIVTAFVGVPFLLLGGLMVAIAGALFSQRYKHAQMVVQVLRQGEASMGEITTVEQNYNVQVNGRHPWVIRYSFTLNSRAYAGQVHTLTHPTLQPRQAVAVLYLPQAPEFNAIYPHP